VRPHTIDAMMRLAGRQQTAVTVHHAGTPEATVVVQIGRAVIYLHSMPTADRFAKIWQGAQPDAEQLPRHRNLERGPRTGPLAVAEPSIVVHAAGNPAATVRSPAAPVWSRPPSASRSATSRCACSTRWRLPRPRRPSCRRNGRRAST